MPAKFCPDCGAPLEAGARFCGKCGAAIAQETEQPRPQQQHQTVAQQPMIQINEEAIRQNVQQAGRELQQGLGQLRKGIESFQPGGELSFVASVARFYSRFPLMDTLVRRMFVIEGRTNRWRFFVDSLVGWLISCVYFIAAGIAAFLFGMLAALVFDGSAGEGFATLIGFVFGLAAGLPALIGGVLLIRSRLHDMNVTGWVYLVNFIPYVNILFSLAVLFVPGTKGPNKYGADPLTGMH